MPRKKKKKRHEDHVDESWLIPYADILTLLLALFIVLFSMSSIDASKFKQLSKAFDDVFSGGTGVFQYQSPVEQDPTTGKEKSGALMKEHEEKGGLGEKDQKELSELQQKVNQYITDNHLNRQLGTSLSGEGLLVTIRDNVLFESGSADVRPGDKRIATEIAKLMVMDPPRSIMISGYTDNVPISTSKYSSNWDLSVMRAVNFMKVLLENQSLDPEWFSAKGFGEFKPIASNDTAEGRAKNRRVEILISPRTELNQ
ncbi:flagellar motor protein MotB [Bacillus testis]|uniref:flagellar motor protein MotB n=1 Tax=Bacillus testis TaxID=1622072 RepID=UPI00067E8AEA|nr:flagellar motor protein MotB [Bacillus testis]